MQSESITWDEQWAFYLYQYIFPPVSCSVGQFEPLLCRSRAAQTQNDDVSLVDGFLTHVSGQDDARQRPIGMVTSELCN